MSIATTNSRSIFARLKKQAAEQQAHIDQIRQKTEVAAADIEARYLLAGYEGQERSRYTENRMRDGAEIAGLLAQEATKNPLAGVVLAPMAEAWAETEAHIIRGMSRR